MITVTYNRRKHLVTVKGHAKSGEAGHDLICAAASILIYTLAANVQSMKVGGSAKDFSLKLDSGDALIKCKAYSAYNSITSAIFDGICAGFELLARDYPKNLQYKLI